ncbi:MAG: hypothetical protein IT307_17015, partial [Chloroflexi bacterium]|nr:hypothetical protein [Chloroflexota bacterium]
YDDLVRGLGGRERERGEVVLRRMSTRDEQQVALQELSNAVRGCLEGAADRGQS